MLIAAAMALAVMAPQYYEQARQTAPEVIVIDVSRVAPPAGKAYGDCFVEGRVAKVERGRRYRAGQSVSIAVSCALPNADFPDGGTLWKDMAGLRRAARGRAFLGGDGRIVMSQYDILP
jgi:hypothetical protein